MTDALLKRKYSLLEEFGKLFAGKHPDNFENYKFKII